MKQAIGKFFKRNNSLRRRVEELEKKVAQLSETRAPFGGDNKPLVPYSQVMDEWLNGEEGADE